MKPKKDDDGLLLIALARAARDARGRGLSSRPLDRAHAALAEARAAEARAISRAAEAEAELDASFAGVAAGSPPDAPRFLRIEACCAEARALAVAAGQASTRARQVAADALADYGARSVRGPVSRRGARREPITQRSPRRDPGVLPSRSLPSTAPASVRSL
jgi:hypothetical protein